MTDMTDVTLRIDNELTEEFSTKLERFVFDTCASAEYLIVHEVSTIEKKPHYHVYLRSVKTYKSIRNKFDYLFKSTHGGSLRSCKQVRDVDHLKSYLLKDGNVIHTTYTQEELDTIVPWVDKKDFKHDDKISDRIMQFMKDEQVDFFDEKMRRVHVMMYVVKYYRKERKVFNKYYMRNLVDYLWYIITVEIRTCEDPLYISEAEMRFAEMMML